MPRALLAGRVLQRRARRAIDPAQIARDFARIGARGRRLRGGLIADNDRAALAGQHRRMWTYHPELLARPVPRYTSYPTAAEFADDVGPAQVGRALAESRGRASAYVHIPFCQRICWYCGCNTAAANRSSRLADYLEALHAEIAHLGERLPDALPVERIAFGGGSPNALPALDFVRLVDALFLHLRVTERPILSIEIDPRTFDAEWAGVIAAIGFERASLGVQTFAPVLQAAIGRVQPDAMIADATARLRDAGVRSLNFDLMYGLPGQTERHLRESLDRTIALGADRIALFGYAHVPEVIARQRRIDSTRLPGAEARFGMAALGHRLLTDAGYVPVGFDHFARPGDPLAQAALSGRLRRNFQGFTDDPAQVLLGLGASAISTYPALIAQNEKNAGRYRMLMSQGTFAARCGVRRTADDLRRGAVIEALLCRGRAAVDPALLAGSWPALQPFVDAGLCEGQGGEIVIHSGGLPYARAIAACFDAYRAGTSGRFSSAV